MSTHPDAPRIIQSNDVAALVIQQAAEHAPGLFVTLDLRYGIADALWAAGYRKDSELADAERTAGEQIQENFALTVQLQAAQAAIANVRVLCGTPDPGEPSEYADFAEGLEHGDYIASQAVLRILDHVASIEQTEDKP